MGEGEFPKMPAARYPQLPSEFARATGEYYAARKLSLAGQKLKAEEKFSSAKELYLKLAYAHSDRSVSAIALEAAARCSLEAGRYQEAIRIARKGSLLTAAHEAELATFLAIIRANAHFLERLPPTFEVNWPELELNDDLDLAGRYKGRRVEVVFDSNARVVSPDLIDADLMRLRVGPYPSLRAEAAEFVARWITPVARELVDQMGLADSPLTEAAA